MVLAFALSHRSSSGSSKAEATAPISVSAPTPSPSAIESCALVLSALPIQLDGLNPRQVHPYPDEGAPVAAWGDPAIVLQCGVGRPAELTEGSNAQVIGVGAVNWLPVAGSNSTVFTVIDRAVYVSVTVPKSYTQPPLATLSDAIAGALPAVCHVDDDVTSSAPAPSGASSGPSGSAGSVGPLCTHRP